MTENQAKEQLQMAGYTVTVRDGDELVLSWPGLGAIGVVFSRHGEVHAAEVESFIENAERRKL